MLQRPVVLILVILLVLAVAGGPWAFGPAHWGYYPSGGLGLIVVVLLILLLLGRI